MNISVVVPFFNEQEHIERCIRALLSQDYPRDRFEIIMIDNNSTDRSAEIVRRYPEIRLEFEPTKGDFAARNRGLLQATGEVIAFTDSDTAPLKDWLTALAADLEDPGIGILVGRLHYPSESRLLAMLAAYEQQRAAWTFSSRIKELYFGYTCNMAVRSRLFEEFGPFPPIQRNSDIVFLRRVIDRHSCDAVRFAPRAGVERLETSTLAQYYSKQFTYGRDFGRYSRAAACRQLTTPERLQLLKATIRQSGYSGWDSLVLLALLIVGTAAYQSGRIRALLTP